MKLISARLLALTLAFSGFLLSPQAQAQDVSVTPEERAKIESVIKDFLKTNPGIVLESLQAHQDNQRAEMEQQFTNTFKAKQDAILKEGHPTVGPETADVTIFEFYDYNCGYCKKAYSDVAQLVENDKNIRFVFIEMPILSETSKDAARWSLAANKQGKFFEYHSALMKYTSQKDKQALEKLAKEVGMDVEQANKDADSKEVLEIIEKNMTLSRELGISGTPAFVINGQLTPGYMGYEGMKAAVADARKAN
ncbi:MAG: DsbA family protein [Micavibrio sp.]